MRRFHALAIAAAMAVLVDGAIIAAAPAARADIPNGCWLHIEHVLEAEREYHRLENERGRKARRIERSMTEAARTGGYASLAVLQRFFHVDLPDLFRTILSRDDAHDAMLQPFWDFVQCARDEESHEVAGPLEVDTVGDRPAEIVGAAKPEPPEPVELGVDCTEPFMVGLPDDVLTECEPPTEVELP